MLQENQVTGLVAVIQHLFSKRKIPVITLPIVLLTWVLVFGVSAYFSWILVAPSASVVATSIESFLFRHQRIWTGYLSSKSCLGHSFFIAVFISLPIAALYALAGAVLSGILAIYFYVPTEDVAVGLYSFNAVLCAIVFAGNRTKDGVWVFIAVILSLVISLKMLKFNIIQLTFPFVAASCISLALKGWIPQKTSI